MTAVGCEYSDSPTRVGEAPVSPKQVVTVLARLETWPETIRVQGSLLAYEDAVVGSKHAGRIASVAVDLGSVVKAAQRLVTLERHELELRVQLAEAQLRQACAAIGITVTTDETQFDAQTAPGVLLEKALVAEAQRNVDRARPLIASRSIAEGEYDAMVAQLQAAQARYHAALNLIAEQVASIGVRRKELALAQQVVAESQIVAPFDGIVGDRRVSPGEFVHAGQAVVTLVRTDQLRFTAGVPESRAASVRVGQHIHIELGERDGAPLVATVSRVSPTVMQSSRAILIEADVPNPNLTLQAGLFAEAELVVDPDAEAVVLPASAIRRFAGVQKVWIVMDGVAKQRTVHTGRAEPGRVEILDGIAAGDLVVGNAEHGLDGPVVVTQEPDGVPLQAHFPETNPAAHESADGA